MIIYDDKFLRLIIVIVIIMINIITDNKYVSWPRDVGHGIWVGLNPRINLRKNDGKPWLIIHYVQTNQYVPWWNIRWSNLH